MPEIFRFFGYSFFFYSREHEPIHVIKVSDQKKIESVIADNKDIIIKRWKEHFDK